MSNLLKALAILLALASASTAQNETGIEIPTTLTPILVASTSPATSSSSAAAEAASTSSAAPIQLQSTPGCPVNLAGKYITAVNKITENSLNAFGRAVPILEPLTMPLAYGLTTTLPLPNARTTVPAIKQTVLRNRMGMKLLGSTMATMVNQWFVIQESIEDKLIDGSMAISNVNEITKKNLGQLGKQHLALQQITDPLSMALTFSPATQLGSSMFNWNMNIRAVGQNLKMFAGNISEMADSWYNATVVYSEQHSGCADNDVVPEAAEVDVVTEAVTEIPAVQMKNCVASIPTRRAYIAAVNKITQTTLTSLAREKPVLIGMTTPLTIGLNFAPIVSLPNSSIEKLSVDVSRVGRGMRLLGSTVGGMVNRWEEAQTKYMETENANCFWPWITGSANCVAPLTARSNFINNINEITRTTLTNLGRTNPRLQRITTPMTSALSFSTITLLGTSIFNFNQPISKTGETLKQLQATFTKMVDQWDATKIKFQELEAQDCASGLRLSDTAPLLEGGAAGGADLEGQEPEQPRNCTPSARATNVIPDINAYTRKTMNDFASTKTRFRSLTNSIWIGLNFNQFTQKGGAVLNWQQDVATTAEDLKQLAEEIKKMAIMWEQMSGLDC